MSLIVAVLERYFPEWEAPEDRGFDWTPCLCPFHGEDNPSASISFERNAFHCHACPASGDAIKIIRDREEVTYEEALGIAETLSPGSSQAVSRGSKRKSRRGVSTSPRTRRGGGQVRSRLG